MQTTVGDTYLLDRMTFAADGAYTFVGSTVIIRLWYGRIHSAYFAIQKADTDDGMAWDVVSATSATLDANILPDDWLTGDPLEAWDIVQNTELQIEVQITLADETVKSFRPGVVVVMPQGIV